MRASKWFLTAAIPLLGLWGCDSSQAKGPGSETTNGIVATVISDGMVASYAGVTLHKADFISNDTTGTVVVPNYETDSLGGFTLEDLDTGKYRLSIALGGKLHSEEISYSGNTLDLGEITLEAPGTVSGTFADGNAETLASWIGVYGLDILVRTDSEGNFTLSGLPAGELKIFALSEDRKSVVADTNLTVKTSKTCSWIHTDLADRSSSSAEDPGSSSSPEESKSSSSAESSSSSELSSSSSKEFVSMVFEDFEDSVSFAAKNWYFSADTAAQINYPTLLSNYWDAVVDNSDRNGHVFSGYFSTEPGGYVIFGTRISTEGIDMSDLDSVTFYAKGSGNLRFALERWESTSSDNLKAWTKDLPLTSSWTRFSVSPTDFQLPEDDTLSTGWESVKKTVTRVHFFATSGQEISLDDITVYGLTF